MTHDLTQMPKITEIEYEGSTSVGDDIRQQLEQISNATGQLNKENHVRPNKYNIQIRDLGERNYHLKEPLFIIIEEYLYDEIFIASYPELEVFGEGVTESEAISNLKLAILDLFEELVQTPEDELGDLPRSWRGVLVSVIEQRNA